MASAKKDDLITRLRKAEEAIRATKARMVGTHDFLPRTQYPFITKFILDNELTEAQSILFKTFTSLLDHARAIGNVAGHTTAFRSAIAAAAGVGECGDQSHQTLRFLLANPEDVVQLTQVVLGSPIERYMHSIILFGDCAGLDLDYTLRRRFASLPATTIVIDPFLNYAGQARNYMEHCDAYLKHFTYDRLIQMFTFSQEMVEKLNKEFDEGAVLFARKQETGRGAKLFRFNSPVIDPQICLDQAISVNAPNRARVSLASRSFLAHSNGDEVVAHLKKITEISDGWKFYKKADVILFTEQDTNQFTQLFAVLKKISADIVIQKLANADTRVIKIPLSAFSSLLKLGLEDCSSLKQKAQDKPEITPDPAPGL